MDQLSPEQPAGADLFQAGDEILLVGRMQREFLARLTPGQRIKVKGEYLKTESLIGLEVGSSVVTPLNASYLALRPTLAERILNMPRQAQIIYPKDLGLILFWADIRPGGRVVEIGTGHGAMTLALVRAVGQTGRVTSYEIRAEHARRTRANVRRFLGQTPWWEVKLANPAETGLEETGLEAVIIDVPAPWELVEAVIPALRPGGSLAFFLPNVPQVVRAVDAFRESGKFANFQTMEALLRPWNVEGPSVRPQMRITGHTGFITLCRRKLGRVVRLADPADIRW